MPPFFGSHKSKPTPRQVAEHLLRIFPIYDARIFFQAWSNDRETHRNLFPQLFEGEVVLTKEQLNQIFTDCVETKESDEIKNAKPLSLTGTEFLALKLPKPSWIIDHVIPKGGLVAFSGKPGAYKSFFALWLAMRASAGLPLFDDCDTDFFCKQDTELTPTMFIEEENTQILTQDRYKGLRRVQSDFLHFRVEQQFKMQDRAWREALLADVEAKGIGMIIVDPFSSVMGLENENDNAEVAIVMDLIRKEFINKGITIVFIHHPSKGDTDGKNLRGAGDILGKCDIHLHFEKDAVDKRIVTVSYEKMRLLPDDEVQNFKMRICGDPLFHDGRFRYLGPAKPKHEEERDLLADEIKKNMLTGESYTKSHLAKECGQRIENDRFKSAWKLLEEKGEIRTTFETKNGHPLFRLN